MPLNPPVSNQERERCPAFSRGCRWWGGRYLVRIGLFDEPTRQALIDGGQHAATAVLEVRSPVSVLSNARMAMNQLVTIEVDWKPPR